MKHPTNRLVIANAFIWAAMMIAISLLFKDHHNAQMVVMLMVVGWMTTQGLIQKAAGEQLTTAHDEIRCIKKLFSTRH